MFAKKLAGDEKPDEKVLVKKVINGDYNAFTSLYQTNIRQVTNYAFKFTNDLQIIEDSVHDIFVWLWNNRENLDITYSFKGYLLTCVRTSILRKIQTQKKTTFLEEADDQDVCFFMSGEDKYIESESYSILQEKMENVLGLLTTKQKEVIYLRYYQGLSFDEIAINMNLTIKACYKLMARAVAELRKSCDASWTIYVSFFILLLNFL